jgi:hypothetical protein
VKQIVLRGEHEQMWAAQRAHDADVVRGGEGAAPGEGHGDALVQSAMSARPDDVQGERHEFVVGERFLVDKPEREAVAPWRDGDPTSAQERDCL